MNAILQLLAPFDFLYDLLEQHEVTCVEGLFTLICNLHITAAYRNVFSIAQTMFCLQTLGLELQG